VLAGSLDAMPGPRKTPIWKTGTDAAETRLAEQAEASYRRLVADWQATRPTEVGAGATPERASSRPSRGNAARQASCS
jgi:hypothetical protein